MPLIKVKTNISVVDDVDTDDFDSNYTMEDVLEECRANALETITEAVHQDIAHITTEVVTNGS